MDEEESGKKKEDAGAPAWVMTFADLMSLLMCFFVLLLSFSEMDVAKYKQIAGSMREAFGVQREIKVKEPPKGINIIAQEFSAGRPDPTPFNIVQQITTDDMKRFLDVGDRKRRHHDGRKGRKGGGRQVDSGHDGNAAGERKEQGQVEDTVDEMVVVPRAEITRLLRAREAAEKRRELDRKVDEIRAALADQIRKGNVEVLREGMKIIIRIRERATFPPGSDHLKDSFRPTLMKIGGLLKKLPGRITVVGHTDDRPIFNDRFRSNWDLSSARAVSVLLELIEEAGLPAKRASVRGLADTRPLVPNDTPAHRAMNRRVEIVIEQGDDLRVRTPIAATGNQEKARAQAIEGMTKKAVERERLRQEARERRASAVAEKPEDGMRQGAGSGQAAPVGSQEQQAGRDEVADDPAAHRAAETPAADDPFVTAPLPADILPAKDERKAAPSVGQPGDRNAGTS